MGLGHREGDWEQWGDSEGPLVLGSRAEHVSSETPSSGVYAAQHDRPSTPGVDAGEWAGQQELAHLARMGWIQLQRSPTNLLFFTHFLMYAFILFSPP